MNAETLSKIAVILLVAILALSGCTAAQLQAISPSKNVTVTGKTFPRSVSGLLAYANFLNSLKTEQLEREFKWVHDQYEVEQSADKRLRLALLLMVESAPFRNLDKAESLLREHLHKDTRVLARDYETLALFLLNRIQSLEKLEKENGSLRHTLEQLKAIEKQMYLPQEEANGAER